MTITKVARPLKRSASLIGVASLTLLVAACGSSSSDATTPSSTSGSGSSSSKPVKIAYLDAARTTYGVGTEKGAQEAAEAGNATVDLFDAQIDPQKQLSQCQDAIATGKYQGILIYPVDPAAAVPCVKQALAADLKVVTVEAQAGPKFFDPTGIQVEGVSAEVYLNPDAQGKGWAAMAAKACGDTNPCELALYTGPPALGLVPLEEAGLENAIADYPNMKLVFNRGVGFDAADAAVGVTRTLLQKHPDLDVIIGDDDATLAGAILALDEAKRTDVKVIGTGANTKAVARIKDGTQFGTITNTPKTDAKVATGLLLDAIRGKAIANPSLSFEEISPLGEGNITLTKDNVDQFTPEWG